MKRLMIAGSALLALTVVAAIALQTARPVGRQPGEISVALSQLLEAGIPRDQRDGAPRDQEGEALSGQRGEAVRDRQGETPDWQPGGPGSQAAFGIRGTIDYTVRDDRGQVKLAGAIHNTVNNEAKNEVFNRITSTGTNTPFDGIAALSVSVGSDDPANGVLAGSFTLNLDGDSGTPGNQNPADGTVVTDFSPDSGKGTISVTFTAQADSVTVKQIVLTKAPEDDTAVSNGTAIADADIFAYVDVPDVTLNTNDTVQYTWTVNVD